MSGQFVLFESASGYCLFEVVEAEEIGALKAEVQASVEQISRFSKLVKLKAFQPFKSAENALVNVNDISEGIVNADLRGFLEAGLPAVTPVKAGKPPKWLLGVAEPKIGTAIQDALGIPCNTNDTIAELVRGVRMHLAHYIPQLGSGNLQKAQLGLAHSYSRAKVKFNVNRSDNMIIQAIALLDQLDKDLNTFAMRVREWYGWHFPELAKLVKDNYVYARIAKHLGDRTKVRDEHIEQLTEIVGEEDVARAIVTAAKTSMGMDISETDLANVDLFTGRLVSLAKYRQQLHDYLHSKMNVVAPNLAALIGDSVGARLISHAGSLTNLAKCPASTVQILGAEKALFRALKTKGNTPKYGLIFHSTFIGRAGAKNKGRISRYLANKCAIASRIDSFSETATSLFGERLRDQVEERLKFYESGDAPRRNIDVMHGVIEALARENKSAADEPADGGEPKKKSKKSKKAAAVSDDEVPPASEEPASAVKDKKRRRAEDAETADEEVIAAPKSEKKLKKKRHEVVEA